MKLHLRTIREARGLSQNALAALADVSQDKISAYENGHVVPSLITLSRLKEALGCEWNDLLK